MQTHFYDEQIRRFLLQLVRMFSNFQVEFGKNDAGDKVFYRVPVKYGDGSRNAAVILQGNSANTLPATPQISLYISAYSIFDLDPTLAIISEQTIWQEV